jgi:processing peptidase subunit beta
VWIDTGSRYEAAADNGVARFAEHMFFKGTAKRSQQNLQDDVESRGARLNALTSREQTAFYAKTLEKDVPWAVEVLSDILQNSSFSPEAVDRERGAIVRQIQEAETQLEEVVFDRLHQTAYRGTALGRTVLASVEQIESITDAQLRKFVLNNFTAPRMVLAGAGAITHQQLLQLGEKHFGSLPTSGREPVSLEPARYVGSSIVVREDDYDYLHLAYGFHTAGWSDADHFPLLVIQSYLGSWNSSNASVGVFSSSPLISKIAEHDLASSVTTFNTQYSDTGLFGVYAVSHQPTWASPMMEHVQDTLSYLAIHVDEQLLEQAKRHALSALLAKFDGSTALCEDIGRQMISYGRHMEIREIRARIMAVDAKAVKACANRYFWDQDFALAAIGPTYGVADYTVMRNRTYLSRF